MDQRPDAAEETDLERGLEQLLRGLPVGSLVQTELTVDPTAQAMLRPEQVAHLLQVTRDALANVIRHARASRVEVGALVAGGCLRLFIVDNGIGMGGTGPAPEHLGLRNMWVRARAAGGQLTLKSGVGRGTQVLVTVPLSQAKEVKRA